MAGWHGWRQFGTVLLAVPRKARSHRNHVSSSSSVTSLDAITENLKSIEYELIEILINYYGPQWTIPELRILMYEIIIEKVMSKIPYGISQYCKGFLNFFF